MEKFLNERRVNESVDDKSLNIRLYLNIQAVMGKDE